jgi:hypothetical protein
MRVRVSIAAVMVVVALAALALVGFREGTLVWAAAVQSVVALVLLALSLTALLARGRRRAFAIGFALFGWAYLAWSVGYPLAAERIPPPVLQPLLTDLCTRLHPVAPGSELVGTWTATNAPGSTAQLVSRVQFVDAGQPFTREVVLFQSADGSQATWPGRPEHFIQIGHALGTLLFGLIGGLWGLREHARRGRAPLAQVRA